MASNILDSMLSYRINSRRQQQQQQQQHSLRRRRNVHRNVLVLRLCLFMVGLLALSYPSLRTSAQYLIRTSAAGRSLSKELLYEKPKPKKNHAAEDRRSDNNNVLYNRNGDRTEPHVPSTSTNNSSSSSSSSNVCLLNDCFQETAQTLARAFPDRTDKNEWCLSTTTNNNNNNNREGLLLVKVPKAASSTSAGVTLRIADRQNCNAIQWQHRPGKNYAQRNPQKSFLLTSIRDPTARIISYLFFLELSIEEMVPKYSDEWMLGRLQDFSGRFGSIRDGQGGFTMQFAALEDIPNYSAWDPKERTMVQNPTQVQARVQRMMEGYDFMLVVERMDESLVALALVLGIDVGDVLVTSSKIAGSYFHDPPRRRCVELAKSFVSPAVKEYLESDDWKAQNYGDFLLHAAANQSLDKTIERLGRDRFDAAMKRYQELKQLEKEQCAPYTQFPCSSEGKPQPRVARRECYQRDFGCGHQCIDDMIATFDSRQPQLSSGGGNSTIISTKNQALLESMNEVITKNTKATEDLTLAGLHKEVQNYL